MPGTLFLQDSFIHGRKTHMHEDSMGHDPSTKATSVHRKKSLKFTPLQLYVANSLACLPNIFCPHIRPNLTPQAVAAGFGTRE